ncbi:MAG: AraC family transcriptional regulator [Candidatus Andeanibacterium colombiense]|uniref:AraC family transcriptional regulator n=1 Tax=Candidatus Andeanibacterium colombiense TaxID=3121345 RepID=A0AAJ5X8N1_9SPHN|nr:MAG: AraC family transcriptional regulator [Sphingomonadaceae bacterium]
MSTLAIRTIPNPALTCSNFLAGFPTGEEVFAEMQSTRAPDDADDANYGLFRTLLAGPGATLREAFGALKSDRWADYVTEVPDCGLVHAIIPIPGEGSDNNWEMISIRDEIFAIVTKCDYHYPRQEIVPSEPFVEAHFPIEGDTTLVDDKNTDMAVRCANMMVCRQGVDTRYVIHCPPGPRVLVSLYVAPRTMSGRFGLTGDDGNPLLRVDLEETVIAQLPIHPDIQAALGLLIKSDFTGMRRTSFAEAKVIELSCFVANAIASFRDERADNFTFSDRDLAIFDRARQLLSTQFSPPLTIPALARAIGTNTNKLKAGFKLIYGMTVFEFANRHRMQHAMSLLSTRHIPISEVANAVGYRSQASFSTAFKEFFGRLPRDVRRESSIDRVQRAQHREL